MRPKYKSLITITTKKSNGTYDNKVGIEDNDDYMKKIGINICNLSEITGLIIKDHIHYIKARRGRKEATTKISLETIVK